MQSLTFNNNDKMPILGLGTWKSDPGEVYNAVREAIKIGYRHIDCAAVYDNEHLIGETFREVLDGGLFDREELWVTSKLWNDKHAAEDVIPACRQTLKDLQLEYLDLYLIHWPFPNHHDPGVDVDAREPRKAGV